MFEFVVSESKCFMNRVTSCDFCSCHVGENKLCASRGDRERYIFPFYAYLLFNCRISLAHLVLHRPRSESFVTVQKLDREASGIVEGANLSHNEYGVPLFANYFFFITGFHGFHVMSGILINIIIFFNVILGTYERRGSYEMVEKVGLYWHFVDLVWVFIFTFFYLV